MRKLKAANNNSFKKENLQLKKIKPLTDTQRHAFECYEEGKNLLLLGSPGTGKTYISLFLALQAVLEKKQNKIILVRSATPSKNVGFLPGTLAEKTQILEEPFKVIVNDLLERGDGYNLTKTKKIIEFHPTSYIRGLTFDDAVIVVDETQNLEWNELYAIMTRLGKNTRIFFCGDYQQSDLKNNSWAKPKEDILKFARVIENMEEFASLNFNHSDIIRSEIVKNFIISCSKIHPDGF